MAEQDDDARIAEIRENHGATCQCSTPWQCDAKYLLERLDALTAERGKWFDCYMGAVRLAQRSGQELDDALARLAAAEAALFGVALRMDLDDLQGCWCVRPKSGSHEHACVAARAALAGSREQERE